MPLEQLSLENKYPTFFERFLLKRNCTDAIKKNSDSILKPEIRELEGYYLGHRAFSFDDNIQFQAINCILCGNYFSETLSNITNHSNISHSDTIFCKDRAHFIYYLEELYELQIRKIIYDALN
jgi:hypothetical protein